MAPGTPVAGAPGWSGPTYTPAPIAPHRVSRRRGPLLFGITLALGALALGVLGLVEASGVTVVDGAYPALALIVVGLMLVLGSVYGRPGGLILLGLVACVALAAVSVAQPRFDGDRNLEVAPTSADQLEAAYDVPAGRVAVDLTDVEDLDSLDGRTLDLSANAGELLVIVPDGAHRRPGRERRLRRCHRLARRHPRRLGLRPRPTHRRRRRPHHHRRRRPGLRTHRAEAVMNPDNAPDPDTPHRRHRAHPAPPPRRAASTRGASRRRAARRRARGRRERRSGRHPLSIGYLVAGLIFLGVAASWGLREAGVVDAGSSSWLFPLTLVVVGAIGLAASVVSSARRP